MINCREAEKAVICIQKQQVWKSSLEKVCRNWVFLQNFYCFFQQIMKLEVIYGQNLKLVTCNALPATLCDSVLKIPAHSDKSFVFWQRLHRHYCHQLFHELLLRFRHLHLSGLHVTQARHPYQRRGHWRYVTSTGDAVALICTFLGAFAKLRKQKLSFVMSVRLSACENSVPTLRILIEFDTWLFFENLSRKFKFK